MDVIDILMAKMLSGGGDPEAIASAVADWLDENVDPVGSAVVVDSSLSIEGAAADAKATGDALLEKIDMPSGGQSGQPLLSDGADGAVWGRSGTYIEARTADPVSGLVTGRVWLVSQDVPTPPTPPTPSTLVYSLNNAVMPPAVVTAETLDVSGAFTIFADFSPSSSIYGSNTSEKFVWVSGHSISATYARRIGVQKWKATYLLYAELSNDFNASYTDIQIPYSAQRCKVAISKQANSSTIDIYTQYDSSSVVKTTFQTSGSDYFNDVIHIGELYDSTNAFAGTFNSFKWFSDALSENQILALFNG